jgi:hypothetical protein
MTKGRILGKSSGHRTLHVTTASDGHRPLIERRFRHRKVPLDRYFVDPNHWLNSLANAAGDHYETQSGGRGVFRVTHAETAGQKHASTAA